MLHALKERLSLSPRSTPHQMRKRAGTATSQSSDEFYCSSAAAKAASTKKKKHSKKHRHSVMPGDEICSQVTQVLEGNSLDWSSSGTNIARERSLSRATVDILVQDWDVVDDCPEPPLSQSLGAHMISAGRVDELRAAESDNEDWLSSTFPSPRIRRARPSSWRGQHRPSGLLASSASMHLATPDSKRPRSGSLKQNKHAGGKFKKISQAELQESLVELSNNSSNVAVFLGHIEEDTDFEVSFISDFKGVH